MAVGRTKCRDRMDSALPHGSGEMFIKSIDEGKTWSEPKRISPQGQENAHLLELKGGRLLCSFTSRIPGLFGVVMRMSSDGGATWSLPVVLISTPPATGTRPTAVTHRAFNLKMAQSSPPTTLGLPWHQRYHMGIAIWGLSLWPDSAL